MGANRGKGKKRRKIEGKKPKGSGSHLAAGARKAQLAKVRGGHEEEAEERVEEGPGRELGNV